MNSMKSLRLTGVLLLLFAAGILFYSMNSPVNKWLVSSAYIAIAVGILLITRSKKTKS